MGYRSSKISADYIYWTLRPIYINQLRFFFSFLTSRLLYSASTLAWTFIKRKKESNLWIWSIGETRPNK